MKKTALAEKIAQRQRCTVKEASQQIEAVLGAITEILASNNDLLLSGFGRFFITHRPSRIKQDPMTGQAVTIPAKAVPTFKPSEALQLHIGKTVPAQPVLSAREARRTLRRRPRGKR